MSGQKGERGRLIRQWRVEMRHTQLSLATALGVGSTTVSRWERGTSEPLPIYFRMVENLHAEHCKAGQ